MIIECPACGARAKLPDSKEGAKVRCVECERVYVARSSAGRAAGSGGGGRRSQQSSTLPILIGGGAVALVLVLLMVRGRDTGSVVDAETPELTEAPKVELGDQTGWNSEPVRFARSLHDAAFNGDEYRLLTQLAMDKVWERLNSTEEAPATPGGYKALSGEELDAFRTGLGDAFMDDSPDNLIKTWQPFDGQVVLEEDAAAVIHLALQPRGGDAEAGTRNIEWKLVREGSQWKAWSWERFYSEAELKADRVARSKKVVRTTLSDGSQVIEAEPGPVPYLDETPPETRKRIDELITKLTDPDLPARELTKVRSELELFGREAVPGLLTKFYEQALEGYDTYEKAVAAQLVHQTLQDITGYVTTFKADEVLGATEERRTSGVRQWFGWYNRKFKRFEGRAEETDLLEEGLQFKDEAERREYEKAKRQIEAEEREKNGGL